MHTCIDLVGISVVFLVEYIHVCPGDLLQNTLSGRRFEHRGGSTGRTNCSVQLLLMFAAAKDGIQNLDYQTVWMDNHSHGKPTVHSWNDYHIGHIACHDLHNHQQPKLWET